MITNFRVDASSSFFPFFPTKGGKSGCSRMVPPFFFSGLSFSSSVRRDILRFGVKQFPSSLPLFCIVFYCDRKIARLINFILPPPPPPLVGGTFFFFFFPPLSPVVFISYRSAMREAGHCGAPSFFPLESPPPFSFSTREEMRESRRSAGKNSPCSCLSSFWLSSPPPPPPHLGTGGEETKRTDPSFLFPLLLESFPPLFPKYFGQQCLAEGNSFFATFFLSS